jgi:hypothetical protein
MSFLQEQIACVELINGDKFEGQLINNSVLSNGTYYYKNGDVYQGSFYNNMKQGYGIYNYQQTG